MKSNHFLTLFVVAAVTLLVSNAASNAANPNNRLPQTSALERDIDNARQSLRSTKSRLDRLHQSAKNARYKIRDAENMLKRIQTIESQIGKILRQLETISRIPQLRILKPLVAGLKEVKKKVRVVRVKADRFRRDVLQPMQTKIKRFESKVSKAKSKLSTVEQSTAQANSKVVELRRFVEKRGMQRYEVSALEQLAMSTRPAVQPLNSALREFDNAGTGVESELNSLSSQMSQVTRFKSAFDKLQRDLSPIEKKANDLNRVLSKSVGVKLFGKRISVSVRQVIESPGKIVDFALKPLTKLANKALKPVLGNFKVNIKAPKELSELASQMDRMQAKTLNNVRTAETRLDNALNSNSLRQFESKMKQLASSSTSRLMGR